MTSSNFQTDFPTGARAGTDTHANTNTRAPILSVTSGFDCPLWPGCGCPGGTTIPDCPGLVKLRKTQPSTKGGVWRTLIARIVGRSS